MPLRWTAVFVALVMAFVAGRSSAPGRFTIREAEAAPVPRELPATVDRFHDASEQVTCWTLRGSGLSCLPDQWLASARQEADTP